MINSTEDSCLEFNIFDILFVNLPKHDSLSIQSGARPCVLVQNQMGNCYAPTLIVLPLTRSIKKLGQPTHGLLRKNPNNGLLHNSMVVGEQICTISKQDVVGKIGYIDNQEDINMVCGCFLANLFGNKRINVEELVG